MPGSDALSSTAPAAKAGSEVKPLPKNFGVDDTPSDSPSEQLSNLVTTYVAPPHQLATALQVQAPFIMFVLVVICVGKENPLLKAIGGLLFVCAIAVLAMNKV
jgi:hypothetical protein